VEGDRTVAPLDDVGQHRPPVGRRAVEQCHDDLSGACCVVARSLAHELLEALEVLRELVAGAHRRTAVGQVLDGDGDAVGADDEPHGLAEAPRGRPRRRQGGQLGGQDGQQPTTVVEGQVVHLIPPLVVGPGTHARRCASTVLRGERTVSGR
jgi:hypothetical protein